uniref:Transmembrane protein n=1 Tax=Angiostrongylus cantonensis TaxID=6313 RepID=A0A158P9U2_ANGCA
MTQDEVVVDPNAQHHDEQPEMEPTQPMELMDPNLHEKDHDIHHQPHDTEIEHDGILELVQRYNEQPTMKDGRSEKNESLPGEKHIGAPVLPGREVESDMLQGSSEDEQRNAMTTKRQQQSDSMSPESTQLGEPYYKTIMDILSIMCLLPLMNDYWEFPVQVARNGGYAFIFLYVIIFAVLVYPTLCFVLFVSQFTQTGLVDVFGMYGPAYKGFGYGYLVLIIISHMSILHDSSILLKHLRVSLDDNPSMFACMQPYVQDWSNCTSVFLDSSCMAAKSRQEFYARGLCWQQPPSEFAESSVNSYIKYLTERTDGQTVDLEVSPSPKIPTKISSQAQANTSGIRMS